MPDGITQALQSITPALKDVGTVANVGSTAYNLYNQYQNQQYQNTLRQDAQNPAKVTALAQGYTQPLTAGLQTGVANNTQAYLAQRGLSDSPQISEQVQAQAIAPYIQQNQQQGYQDALQALQLGGGAIPPALQQQNSLAALTKAFSQINPGGTSSINPALFAQLMQQGTVQPAQVDPGPVYQPDYGADLQPSTDWSSQTA